MKSDKPKFYAWLVFLLSVGFLFYKYMLFVSPAIVVDELIKTYSLSGVALGFLVSAYFYTYFLMQIPAGLLTDRFGLRKITTLALLCATLGIFIFALAPNLWMAYLGRLLIGCGVAFAGTLYMKLASVYFPVSYFPMIASFFGVACMAGAGTAETPLAWLSSHIGWREALFVITALGTLWMVFAWFLLKDKAAEARFKELHKEHEYSVARFKKILKLRANWILLIYVGFAFVPLTVFGGLWGIPYVMASYGASKLEAASAVSFGFFGFVVGGMFIDYFAKHLNSQRLVIILGTLFAAISFIIMIYMPRSSLYALTGVAFVFGFFASSYLAAYAVVAKINDAKNVSSMVVLINMIGPVFAAVAEPLVGKILDFHWAGTTQNGVRMFDVATYHHGLNILIGSLLLAFIISLFIKE